MATPSSLVVAGAATIADRSDCVSGLAEQQTGVGWRDVARLRNGGLFCQASHPEHELEPAVLVREVHGFLTSLRDDVEQWRETSRVNLQHADEILAKVDRLLGLTRCLHHADHAAAPCTGGGRESNATDKRASLLTRRQWDVARLVADGLTNAEIAQRLVLTPGTVGNHVGQMIRRLGVRNRAQVAAWVTECGLRHEAVRTTAPPAGRAGTGD